jgi:hypothetical protein
MKILKRLLPAQDVDALLGDIAEEAPRRSRVWYWGQLLAVLIVGSWRDVRAHKWLAVRATVTGLLVLPVFFYPVSPIVYPVRVLSEGGYYVGPYWLTLPREALSIAPFFANLIAFGLSGWIVTRLHRAHGLAMVLPYLLLVCMIPAAAIMRLLTDTHAGRSLIGPSPLFVAAELSILSLPVCVLFGALIGTRRA